MSIESSAPGPSSIATRDTTGPHNCEMCKILFNSEEELANHTQEVHKGTMTSKGTRSVVSLSSAARKSTKAKSKTKTNPKKRKVTTKKISNSKKRAKRSK